MLEESQTCSPQEKGKRQVCLHVEAGRALSSPTLLATLGKYKGPTSLACRCSHRRIGEAKSPGPARGRQFIERGPLASDQVEVARPETLAIGRVRWEKFLPWLRGQLEPAVLDALWLNHGLLAALS